MNETESHSSEPKRKRYTKAQTAYYEKLKDPRWQKLRLKVLERDGFKCRRCFSTENELQVHHLKYSPNPWESDSADLVTLCKTCHSDITESNKVLDECIKQMKQSQLFVLYDWLTGELSYQSSYSSIGDTMARITAGMMVFRDFDTGSLSVLIRKRVVDDQEQWEKYHESVSHS